TVSSYGVEIFDPKLLFVAQAVSATLDHPYFVVEPLDEAERDLILRLAVGGDPAPMSINHRGELLVWLEPLPLEAGAPIFKKWPPPTPPSLYPPLGKTL